MKMPLPAWPPAPYRLLRRAPLGRVLDGAVGAVAIPGRLLRLLDEAEVLLAGAAQLSVTAQEALDRAARTVHDVSEVTGQAREVVRRSGSVTEHAAATVAIARHTATGAQQLLDQTQPAVTAGAPLIGRFLGGLSASDAEALSALVVQLPVLTDRLRTEILPVLVGLDRVAPDLAELLEAAHDLRRALMGVPGFGVLRRRGEERLDQENDEPAEEGSVES